MRFEKTHIASCDHLLAPEVVSSDDLERRLEPIYARMGLNVGRLELMTGIRERRFFEPGTRPSTMAARAGRAALEASGIDPRRIGCLIHASVCRDFLEPATASVVHHHLGLPERCMAFDLSNACLGFSNAMAVIGGLIERGDLEAGLIVAAEDGRPLVESTIASLLGRETVTKEELKLAFASLTIGSGAAAMVLARADLSPDVVASPRLVGTSSMAASEHHVLCQGDHQAEIGGPLMQTDSEGLLHAGTELAARNWIRFHEELGWAREDVDRVVMHQVGVAHRRLVLGTLEIDPAIDFPTVEELGNIGSVSLPLTFSRGRECGFLQPGQRVGMIGIGSGLQCMMLGVQL